MRNILIGVSFFTLLLCFWNRNVLPSQLQAHPLLHSEPTQIATQIPAINVSAGAENYTVTPLYEYELYGLVVSYQHHNGNFGLHRMWKDHLNVADVCVVWGQNLQDTDLTKLHFWNGQFTCNVQTSDPQAWKRFAVDQLSNNHLLTADKSLRNKITQLRIGDQVKIKGWLSEYRSSKGFHRGTSTSRSDTGNGACETLYVSEVDIIHRPKNPWRSGMYFSFIVFIGCSLWHFASPLSSRG